MIARLFIDKPGTYLVHPDDLQRLVTVPDATQEVLDRLEAARIIQPPRTDDDADLYGACLDALYDDAFEAVEFVRCDSMESIPQVEPDPISWLAPAMMPTSYHYVARRNTTT